MPVFPERESSLIAKLHQSAPWTAKLHKEGSSDGVPSPEREPATTVEPVSNGLVNTETPAVNIGIPMEPIVSTDTSMYKRMYYRRLMVYGSVVVYIVYTVYLCQIT